MRVYRLALLALLLSSVVAIWIFRAYRHDIDAARLRSETGSEIAQTPCGPIEYISSGAGIPILVVHGAGGGFDQGSYFAGPLATKGFRVIAVSRFGYLRTPLPRDASSGAQADAYACLLDALSIQRAAVIGASAGAPSSMLFALKYPERTSALVLLVPAAYTPRAENGRSLRTPPGLRLLFDTALRSDFLFWAASHFARGVMVRSVLATPTDVVELAGRSEQMRIAQVLESILPVSRRRLGLINDAAVTAALPRYDLEKITAPTLVMSTRDDLFGTFDGARYTAEHIPNARFLGFARGGHLWVGHEQELLSELEKFLKTPVAEPGVS